MLNTQAREELRRLLPPGMLATKRWLIAQGLNPHFVDNAVRSKTLQPLVNGVFTLYAESLKWEGVVTSLQRMSPYPVHVGGVSALAMAGLAQYLATSATPHVHLYSPTPLPRWLSRLPFDMRFEGHRVKALWHGDVMSNSSYIRQQRWQEGLPSMFFSSPEKAIFEVLVDVPKTISFEHADGLMQGLYNLSPRKLDTLMRACASVKAKRLFLWLAERNNHVWVQALKSGEYDLGSGNRVIATKGRLDKSWRITVPKDM